MFRALWKFFLMFYKTLQNFQASVMKQHSLFLFQWLRLATFKIPF